MTQYPLISTQNDFWGMVWKQRVASIISLVSSSEKVFFLFDYCKITYFCVVKFSRFWEKNIGLWGFEFNVGKCLVPPGI